MRPCSAATALALSAALALAACGGDDDADTPLGKALSYIPADAPLALTISTDVEGEQYQQLGDLIERFPGGDQVVQGLRSSIEAQGTDFDEEIRPLLGNDLVVGAPDAEALSSDEGQFVGALQVNDTETLQQVIDDQQPTEAGEIDGAQLYGFEDDTFIAVDDDVVVFSDTQEQLEAALVQSGEDDSLTEDTFNEALGDAPEDAPLRVYANLPPILEADPEAQQAQDVAWVGALETVGLTASAEEEGLVLDLDVATNPEGLTEDDLPIASGAEDPPPVVADDDQIGIGIRDPSQVADFAQLAAEQAGAGEVALAKSQISDQLGIDIDDDVIGQLTGEAAVTVDLTGQVGFRSELQDPAAFGDTLEQISDELPQAAAGLGAPGVQLAPTGGGFYELRAPDSPPVSVGVVGGVLAIAGTQQEAQRLAGAAPQEVPDAAGSVTMRADASTLAEQALEPLALLVGDPAQFTEPLGDLTGSMESDTSGLRGRFLLTVE